MPDDALADLSDLNDLRRDFSAQNKFIKSIFNRG